MGNNYSLIISEMVWSYSRITAFESCPYQFLLKYIYGTDKKRQFFSDYGGFIHELIAMQLYGLLSDEELPNAFLMGFKTRVPRPAPNLHIFETYFNQGLEYMKHFSFPYNKVTEIESKKDFQIRGKRFVGIIDAVAEDDGLIIVDNKSRALKPRSKRKKPTKDDKELDMYLRQLYLYAAAIEQDRGSLPKYLHFNCFRTGTQICELFDPVKYQKTLEWAVGMTEKIETNTNWDPDIEYWKCRHLCDVSHHCCYCGGE